MREEKLNKTVATLLAIFLGGLGIHKFYLGKIGIGFFYLLFCWTYVPAFIAIIDCFVLASMSKEEFDKEYNCLVEKR